MSLTPKQSFQHTLQEISVNRDSPCELVRELVSNSYDADAKNILIFPLLERTGLIFFDDGVGLSMINSGTEVSPYVAFFSIGFGTKTKGEQIGYKCQGSKLCFASGRFSLITRCSTESTWRYITIENPKKVLSADYNIEPQISDSPEKFLKNFLINPDKRTKSILDYLDKDFFEKHFQHGTMIIIESFEASDYEKYFSVESTDTSFLYNYIRFYTAHGDTRLINTQQGFSALEVKTVLSNFKQPNCTLKIWMTTKGNLWKLVEIPKGWPYLEIESKNGDMLASSPNSVKQLRSGRFYSRNATSFKFDDGQVYTLIFAIDGKRRALDNYKSLGRQRSRRSGISLSSQQGVSLSSHGVKICSFNKLLDNEILREFSILNNGTDHFMFTIDGDFELITSRNQLAEKSKDLLSKPNFLNKIKQFLQDTSRQKDQVLKELLQRLNRENTANDENKAIQSSDRKKESINERQRQHFLIKNIDVLKDRWFVSPIPGEEHFVGALYTLFSHIIATNHKFIDLWKRPLTFSGVGIDAIALNSESLDFNKENLISIEYKYWFSINDEFNHPLSVVNHIICWDFDEEINLGMRIEANYDYVAQITHFIEKEENKIGLKISEIRKKSSHRFIGNEVIVLSLKRLLNVSFNVEWLEM